MSPSEDAISLARRFVAAVRQCYSPGARIWHNVDGKVQSVDENIKGVHWIHRVLENVQHRVKPLVGQARRKS